MLCSSYGTEEIMAISKATAQWNGGLKEGKGTMQPAHAAEVAFTLGSRFEGQPSSNPEELIGAALAGCFSMALTSNLEKAGFRSKKIQTTASVHLEREDNGFTITTIELTTEAFVESIDDAQFQKMAEETKNGCPVSKALSGTKITLQANLLPS